MVDPFAGGLALVPHCCSPIEGQSDKMLGQGDGNGLGAVRKYRKRKAACEAWRSLLAEPTTITSIGHRGWAHVGQIRSHHRLLLDGIGASRDGEGGA